MIGTTIDRYQVVEEIGRGGMGVVYRARDTLLGRTVALKVLSADRSFDSERRERFLREAKSASSLNHPGIVAVHDMLELEGRDVLVMEFVEGETLEEVIAGGPLDFGRALRLGVDIAGALARAHSAGIVHRDLKPANIMVTRDGVKILDFGLAKLTTAPFSDSQTPTMGLDDPSLTKELAVLGTIAWMSPEQTEGGPVDARTDIFAFGVLLYEMLTGRQPFKRGSTPETIAAIRHEDPAAPARLVPALPQEADRAVMRCLRKEPEKRWQSLSDLGVVLEGLRETVETGSSAAPGRTAGRLTSRWPLVAAAVAVVAVAVAVGITITPDATDSNRPLEIHRLTYDASPSIVPGISPDGKLVAFSSERSGDEGFDIWVRHINQPEPVRLTTHPSDDQVPRFSPDGSKIVFESARDGGGIYTINALGGGLRRVSDHGMLPRFTPDGSSIIFVGKPGWAPSYLRPMSRIPAHGGDPAPYFEGWGVSPPPQGAGPVFSPDGRYLMFKGAPIDDPRAEDWWVAPVDGGEPWSSGRRDAFPRLDVVEFPVIWFPNRLLFLTGSTIEGVNLHSVEVSDRGMVTGSPSPLVSGPGITWMPTASRDGLIALSRFNWVVHLWEVELDRSTGRALGPVTRTTDDAAPKYSFSLTEDGNQLAFSTYSGSQDSRRGELIIQDRVTGEQSVPVTLRDSMVTTSAFPRLSSDGSTMSWRGRVDGQGVSWIAPTADPFGREICRSCLIVGFFPGDQQVLIDFGDRLSRVDVAHGGETTVIEFDHRALLGCDLSPDGRWVAMHIGEPDGSVGIFVAPLDELPVPPESFIEVSTRLPWVGSPRWSADLRFVYFISERDDFLCIWGRELDPVTKRPVGEEFAIAHAHSSEIRRMSFARYMWNIEVGGNRLVFNAGELAGDVYTAQLDLAD